MRPCAICGGWLPDGVGVLGICPHGDAHPDCCLRRVEDHLAARTPLAPEDTVEGQRQRSARYGDVGQEEAWWDA